MTAAVLTPECVPSLASGFRFQWEKAQDAYVLLYPEGMVTLNGSSGEIMRRVDGRATIHEIIADLHKAYPDADASLGNDVMEFFANVTAEGWINV